MLIWGRQNYLGSELFRRALKFRKSEIIRGLIFLFVQKTYCVSLKISDGRKWPDNHYSGTLKTLV